MVCEMSFVPRSRIFDANRDGRVEAALLYQGEAMLAHGLVTLKTLERNSVLYGI